MSIVLNIRKSFPYTLNSKEKLRQSSHLNTLSIELQISKYSIKKNKKMTRKYLRLSIK